MEVSLHVLRISGKVCSTLKHLYNKRSVSLDCYSKMRGQAYYKIGFWYILNELRMWKQTVMWGTFCKMAHCGEDI